MWNSEEAMSVKPLVALDIGSTKVACAVGLPHERSAGFELLGSSVVAYPTRSESWLSDPLMVGQTIEQALEATAVSQDLHAATVAITHPLLASERARVTAHLADEPLTVRAQDLERLRQSAVDQTLAIDRDPLLVERLGCAGNGFDGVRDPRGLSATRLAGTFLILTIPLAARRALIQAVGSAGLEVARLTYTLPAALASVEDDELAQKRVLMLDVGGLSTDVGLFVEGVLHALEVVPFGGMKLAAVIASDRQVTVEQAVAWSLEGTACRKPEGRAMIEQQWGLLQQAIARVLKDQPRPDAVLLCGRGALIDGFAEWTERVTSTKASLCRSARTNRLKDLTRQLSLSVPIGLLELATRSSNGPAPRPGYFINRLIERTRTILTEYF